MCPSCFKQSLHAFHNAFAGYAHFTIRPTRSGLLTGWRARAAPKFARGSNVRRFPRYSLARAGIDCALVSDLPICGWCCQQAAIQKRTLSSTSIVSLQEFAFTSTYIAPNGAPRGFCNWLIPGKVMVGRYPHVTPFGSESGSPKANEAKAHLSALISAGVNTFVSLQDEVPSQESASDWPEGGVIHHADDGSAYPLAFQQYLPDAIHAASQAGVPTPTFLRFPIRDFGVPDDEEALLIFLQDLADRIIAAPRAPVPYIHCWAGRGRTGTVGACLLLLLDQRFATLPRAEAGAAASRGSDKNHDTTPMAAEAKAAAAAARALRIVQAGFDSRAGHKRGVRADGRAVMRSPETDAQHAFVLAFARRLMTACPPPAAVAAA